MTEPIIIREKITREILKRFVVESFETMAKVDVDVEREILTIGGEWHSQGEDVLVRDGSSGLDVWGANFYPWREANDRIEFVSLINIKPPLGHKKMEVQSGETRAKMRTIIGKLLLSDDETLDL